MAAYPGLIPGVFGEVEMMDYELPDTPTNRALYVITQRAGVAQPDRWRDLSSETAIVPLKELTSNVDQRVPQRTQGPSKLTDCGHHGSKEATATG